MSYPNPFLELIAVNGQRREPKEFYRKVRAVKPKVLARVAVPK